jgi:hypothetical protein
LAGIGKQGHGLAMMPGGFNQDKGQIERNADGESACRRAGMSAGLMIVVMGGPYGTPVRGFAALTRFGNRRFTALREASQC